MHDPPWKRSFPCIEAEEANRTELYAKKEHESILTKTLGGSPKLRIIDFFLNNPLFDFTKKQVVEALGMSKQTFYKCFSDLEKYGMVKVSRKIVERSYTRYI